MNTVNLKLILPAPTKTLGPEWATKLNTALETIDNHDHSTDKGKKIVTAGLNINSDLDIIDNDVEQVKTIRLSNSLSPLTDTNQVYISGGNLYFNNELATNVQITSGNDVLSSPSTEAVQLSSQQFNSSTINIVPFDTYSHLLVNTSTFSPTVTLPLANSVSAGRFYIVTDVSNNAINNNITIIRSGADTIDAGTSVSITAGYGSVKVVSNGVNGWSVISFFNTSLINSKFQNDSVTTTKIADNQVTSLKLASTTSERDWLLSLLGDYPSNFALGSLAMLRFQSGGIISFGSNVTRTVSSPANNFEVTNIGGSISGTFVPLNTTWKCLGHITTGSGSGQECIFIRVA